MQNGQRELTRFFVALQRDSSSDSRSHSALFYCSFCCRCYYYCYFSALLDTDIETSAIFKHRTWVCDLWRCLSAPIPPSDPTPAVKSLNNKHRQPKDMYLTRASERAIQIANVSRFLEQLSNRGGDSVWRKGDKIRMQIKRQRQKLYLI